VKKLFPIALMLLGLVFVAAGGYTVLRGFDAKDQVRNELIAQNITTPEDASIPNAVVKGPKTAEAMADIIQVHANEATEGRTYSEVGRYLAVGGGDTNDAALAVTDDNGRPVANPVRNTAFQAATLRTSLYTSIMAWNVADLVVGLGLMIVVLGFSVGGLGVALGALAIPSLARRAHVEPIAAH
jgi:hypothetical protein